MEDYKKHRLYAEFEQLRVDDAVFAELWDDSQEEFLEWALSHEVDSDWQGEDFAVGVELVIQNLSGVEIAVTGGEILSDETMQRIIEDVAEYLNERGLT